MLLLVGLRSRLTPMNKEDGIEIEVGDENQPNVRLLDTEIGESIKRLCRDDNVKKYLYDAVENHRKMTRNPIKDHVIHGAIFF